jgi:hypothetical protein
VRPELLRVASGAHYEDEAGHRHAMTRAHLGPIFRKATQLADGSYRFGLSLYVEGRPIGPWRYEGLREDDPNDAVPHQDRRDVRAGRLIAAWLNHFDSREQNTLATFVPARPSGGYVRHYMLDFADCLGGVWPIDAMSRRMGHSYYFDPEHVAEDFLTLGLLHRPWDHATVDPYGWPFGYFSARAFAPERWRGGYPNPAFDRMTERDGAWMARILARLSDAHLRAVIAEAHYRAPEWNDYLLRTLAARRDAILARYLTRLSPLADVTVRGDVLCATDRAVTARVFRRAAYGAALGAARDDPRARSVLVDAAADGRVCARLPSTATGDPRVPPGDPSRYRVAVVREWPEGRAPVRPLYVHLYDLGPARGFVLAGLERE